MALLERLRSRPKLWASAALVTGGLTAGAIIGSTMSATAATSSTSASSTGSSASGSAPTGTNGTRAAQAPPAGSYKGLPKSGSVTAVGSNSVTIDGTTYAVTSSSDIDKNGEAVLKDLAVGDKVTFSTVSGASTATIDKLHAGSESLDRPTGPPMGGGSGAPGGAGYGLPPSGSQSGSSSTSAAA